LKTVGSREIETSPLYIEYSHFDPFPMTLKEIGTGNKSHPLAGFRRHLGIGGAVNAEMPLNKS
jgi:hypothetical protein